MTKTEIRWLRKIYNKLAREFLMESGVHGLKIFLSTSPVHCAKYLWFIFLTSIIVVTHVIIVNLYLKYLDQPTEVRLSTKLVHVANSPFPAVAICSANKISRQKLMRYAATVYEAQQKLQPGLLANNVNEMAEHIKLLTGFFLYPSDIYSDEDVRLSQLHNILTSMYNGSDYPTREILFSLAPDCEELIIRGLVFGKFVNVTRYFEKRTISVGACCLFNYQRDTYSTNSTRATFVKENVRNLENVTFESNSILNSIQFVLQSDPSDFAHTEFASYAFRVYLFPRRDYPTIMTSAMGQILINTRSIVEIPVQPTFYEATRSIRDFSPAVRECYFKDEGRRALNKTYYSLNECLLICRMQSMQRYCGCVSPLLAPPLINASICTLIQLPCLTHWMRVFNQWTYFEYVEQTHAPDKCQQCIPTCSGVDYTFYSNTLPLRGATADNPYSYGLLKDLNSVKPLALVKLYFKQRYAESTNVDVVGDWVNLLSRFGGILSLFYGFSILSYVEVFYFLSGKWFVLFYKSRQRRDIGKKKNQLSDKQPIYSLYWRELQPTSAKFKTYPNNIVWQKRPW